MKHSLKAFLAKLTPDERQEVEFTIRPLAEQCKELGIVAQSFDQAAQACGYKNFEEYRVIRHRQWLLTQLPAAIQKAQADQKMAASGQQTLF